MINEKKTKKKSVKGASKFYAAKKAVEEDRTPKPMPHSKKIIANRTMDLSMLDTMGGQAFERAFLAFRALVTAKGIPWHVDGADNPRRRHWEYFWLLENTMPVLAPCAKVMDAGCGIAPFQFFLLQRYQNIEVVGVDDGSQSPNFVKFCNNVSEKLGFQNCYTPIKTNLANMRDYFDDNEFDVIFSVSVIEHVDDEAVISELCRILKGGGSLSITFDFHKDEFPDRKDRLYTKKDLERIIRVAADNEVDLLFNENFQDFTDWSNPPVNLGPPPDYKYNFGALFFVKRA